MATTATTSTSTTPTQEESDYDSSCSSITVPESGQSWVSDLSFGSRSSSVSVCSYSTTDTTQLSYGHHKPHKANHLAWEAMKRLRDEKGRVGLDHFRLLRRLGSGDLGNVYLCQLRNTPVGLRQAHCFYAMKVVDREALAFRNKLQRAEMEKEILGMLDHPFLPTLYAEFDASHYSCLVMEFCPGGDLHAVRLRQPSKRFCISSAKFYASETLLALEYLHMMGIVYRDLKPENVLVREDGHIMLSDFDLSLKCDVVPKLLRSIMNNKNSTKSSSSIPSCASPIQPVLSCFLASNSKKNKNKNKNKNQEEATGNKVEVTNDEEDLEEINGINPELVAEPINARSKSFVGTHEYLAPEVISGLGHGSAVDWWTFGVFLYEMIYGITPFKGENNEKTLINIIKKPLTFPNYTASRMISRDMEELIRAQDLIGKLLVKNPKKRIGSLKGSAEIKRHEFFKGVNWALIRSVKPPEVPRDFQKVTGKSLLPKSSKQEKGATYQIPPHHHFDYF